MSLDGYINKCFANTNPLVLRPASNGSHAIMRNIYPNRPLSSYSRWLIPFGEYNWEVLHAIGASTWEEACPILRRGRRVGFRAIFQDIDGGALCFTHSSMENVIPCGIRVFSLNHSSLGVNLLFRIDDESPAHYVARLMEAIDGLCH